MAEGEEDQPTFFNVELDIARSINACFEQMDVAIATSDTFLWYSLLRIAYLKSAMKFTASEMTEVEKEFTDIKPRAKGDYDKLWKLHLKLRKIIHDDGWFSKKGQDPRTAVYR